MQQFPHHQFRSEDELDERAFYLAGYDADAVSGLPPEPRRYAAVPHCDDELTLVEPAQEQLFTRLSHEVPLNNRLSRQLAYTRQTQRQVRRRDLALDIGNWVAGVILLAFLGAVVAYGFLGVNVLELIL